MKQSTIKALDAIERIWDRCEEIEPKEYRMFNDYLLIRRYIEKEHEAIWELVYHDDHPSYYAHYVTARCSKCKNWFWGNKEHPGDGRDKYGVKLWSAFCMDYGKDVRTIFKFRALSDAEEMLKKSNDLPTFCEHCGARMREVRYSWEDFNMPEEYKE